MRDDNDKNEIAYYNVESFKNFLFLLKENCIILGYDDKYAKENLRNIDVYNEIKEVINILNDEFNR